MVKLIFNSIYNIQEKFNVTRAAEWWYYKGSPVLGTLYVTSAMLNVSPLQIWQLLGFILFALTVTAAYANILNDFTDQEDDRACGKKNMMLGRSLWFKVALFSACILPALVVVYFISPSPITLIIYLGMWFTFSAYSLPPLRLKNRSIWGVIADSLGAHVFTQLFAVLVVMYWTEKTLPLIWIISLVIWSFFTGLRGIFWHQIKDVENDRKTEVNTLATRFSPESLQQWAKYFIFPLEIIAYLMLLILSKNILVWFLLTAYLLSEWWIEKVNPDANIIIVTYQNKLDRMAMYRYYEILYPLAFLLQLGWQNQYNWLLLLIHLLLYPKRIKLWGKDILYSMLGKKLNITT